MLVDTHAHIHFEEFESDLDDIFVRCQTAKVNSIITVGTDDIDSKKALEFAWKCQDQVFNLEPRPGLEKVMVYASAGLHPHDASRGQDALLTIKELVEDGGYGNKLVAVGECGLDYYRNKSSKTEQTRALEYQIELALVQGLPLIFHVRDAWEDFFATIKNYPKIRGVLHSFTATTYEVKKALEYDLYFGLNGIMTFTKNKQQLEAAKLIPNDKLLLETDCPFLSPEPLRGKRNEPANLKYVAEFLAKLRNQPCKELAKQTTQNAKTLFGIL